MPDIDATVWVFDPVLPFEKIAARSPGIDTWHDEVLITKKLRNKLLNIAETEKRELKLSGGMSLTVPSIELGLQIGSIQIPKIRALVVDEGFHDILLGSAIFRELFKSRDSHRADRNTAADAPEPFRYSSEAKEDPSALSIEIYPVEMPFPLHRLEQLIRNQRIVYNIALIANGDVQVDRLPENAIDKVINDDAGIPENLTLQISCIDSGSIWMSLKSGSQAALKRLGSIFETGASAKLSEQLASAKKAENDASISEATRNEVAAAVAAEQEKLRAENIHKTYEVWRSELRAQLDLLDELIDRSTDKKLVAQLKKRRNDAILQIAEQQMVPIVRNIPGSFVSYDDGVPRLPAPRK